MHVVRQRFVALLLALVSLVATRSAFAGSKEECLEAHGRGQAERDKGQLSRARHTFTTCAQSSCPSLVQADCARMSEELAHLVPSVTFAARDASGGDLPATSVFVDDVLVATRLDDGKAYEIDPGKHAVRFVNDGGEATLRVVLNQGEKGRVVAATIAPAATASGTPSPTSRTNAGPRAAVTADPPEPKRSALPLGVAAVGAAALATGAVLTGIGLSKVPSRCSMSTTECATAPNDPAIGEAKSAVSLANTGIGIGVVGVAALAGGVVWYLLQPTRPDGPRRGQLVLPNVLTF